MRALAASMMLTGLLLGACSDNDTNQEKAEPATPAPESASPQPAEPAPAPISHEEVEVLFRCTDGVEFTVTFGDQSAVLTHEDREYELRQQPAASGTRYAGDEWELISRDGQATLISGETTRDCTRLEEEQISVPGADEQALEAPPELREPSE